MLKWILNLTPNIVKGHVNIDSFFRYQRITFKLIIFGKQKISIKEME
jgi:hypothetical protein